MHEAGWLGGCSCFRGRARVNVEVWSVLVGSHLYLWSPKDLADGVWYSGICGPLNDSGKQVYFRYLLNAFRYWFVIERGGRVLGLQDGVGS